jgi:hypothetical protein
LRAQTAASSLAAGLSVLSNFVAVSMKPRDRQMSPETDFVEDFEPGSVAVEEDEPAAPVAAHHAPTVAHRAPPEPQVEWVEEPEEPLEETREPAHSAMPDRESISPGSEHRSAYVQEIELPAESEPETVSAAVPAFDVASLSGDMQDLHRRANRVAKVAMQDIKLLHPNEVRAAREQRNICGKLRGDLDKARKEYDRRFRAIHEHPVDYFHHWMVKILADGDAEALGEYPYPSPVLRH